jgi:UDP-3-O-[3-hydroxymyristoyl] N-acetylglucosamine deacetylase/3-hydroxyacyl-[acyl-carrier-protein] dehydratase
MSARSRRSGGADLPVRHDPRGGLVGPADPDSGTIIGSDGFGFAFDNGRYHKVPQVGNVIVGDDVEIGANTTIDRATTDSTRIGDGTKIDNLVQIGHNVIVGRHCIIVAQVGISGSTQLEDFVTIGGQAGLVGHIRVGERAMVGAKTGVSRSVEPGEVVSGYPAMPHGLFKRVSALLQKLPQIPAHACARGTCAEARAPGGPGGSPLTGRLQRTIARAAGFEGVGLHTGEIGTITFRPAEPDTGVRFVRTDLPQRPIVRVSPGNAHFDPGAGRRTILQEDGVQIHTMEHVLAAIAGLGLDNLIVETSTMEIAEGADGSAAPIARVLRDAGIVEQDRPARHVKITKPVHWSRGNVEMSAEPLAGFRITYSIDYDHPLVGHQTVSFDINEDTFMHEIAPARTFVLERDLEQLRSSGWIKGGRLESAVVIGDDRLRNPEPLRFADEFARHKVLDLLGDLFLLGGPMLGHVRAKRGGHQSHVAFVKHLRDTLPLPGRRPGSSPQEWDTSAIMELLPHRYPFRSSTASRRWTRAGRSKASRMSRSTSRSSRAISRASDHAGGADLEAMAQVGACCCPFGGPSLGKLMYFMGIDNAKFRRPVTPGDQLRMRLTLLKLKKGTAKMQAEAFVEDQLVAEAELLAMVVDRKAT